MRFSSLCVWLALGGCGADSFIGGGSTRDDTSTPNVPGDGAGGGGGGGAGGTGLPSEDETDRLSLRPAQTDVYVFVANPDRDTVTRINVLTQEVKTVSVGHVPNAVVTTPDNQSAVVYNAGGDSVSVIHTDPVTKEMSVQTVDVRDNLNTMSLSSDGKYALLWHDAKGVDVDAGTGGAASYNEVSVVNIAGMSHTAIVVGFNPKGVRYTRDGSRAIVFSDASIASVDLTGASPDTTFIPIADPLDAPSAEEVEIDPAGHYAFVRQAATDALTVVDLQTREVESVPVGQNPTDLDLTPDGLGAVVVSRAALEVSVFSVADPFADPRVVPFPDATPFGSVIVGADDLAVLFTNATPADRYALWTLSGDQISLHPLIKPAASIARTPDGGSLMVVHTSTDNPDGSTPLPYQKKPAVSLIDLSDFRTNTISLSAPILGFANSSDGKRGYVTMVDKPFMEVLHYDTLIYDEVALRSNAVFVGVLPDLDVNDGDQPPAWVSQVHPLGRMSFYDPDDASLETITGFELNGAIEE